MEETSAVIGSSVDLGCHADGVPQPSVRWVRNGQPITFVDHPNMRVDNAGQTLRLHSVQLVDIGSYTCIASNDAGNASKQFLLNILGMSLCLSVCLSGASHYSSHHPCINNSSSLGAHRRLVQDAANSVRQDCYHVHDAAAEATSAIG